MPAPTNPRATCVQALQRWETSQRFADEVLHDALTSARFSTFDRAFLTETFYGILRHLSSLDFLIRQLRDADLDLPTRQVLRLGFYQIFRMRIPHHAAVNETVNLAGRARGLVNALLRRSIREKEELEQKLEKAAPDVRYSHPAFLIERWKRNFDEETASKLCAWNNTPAEIYVRANGLRVTPSELQSTVPGVEPCPAHPLMLKVRQVPYLWIMQGLCYVQDPSTLMACELLAPQPGEKVLDACAAPGGKTSYMAELMRNEGRIYACDSSRSRLDRLHENLQRLGITNTEVQRVDWLSRPLPFGNETFDRILVDSPCSNTGVIRRRVDVRWRLNPADFEQMPRKQRQILETLVPLLKPGGTLVYSTCSLELEENEQLAEQFAQSTPEVALTAMCRREPHRHDMDGSFAAKFVKAG
ncbi:MAG: 16S rRNA (cytosine(967)-C(5))-methyltransferase RsmB [Verrucomicrobiota bacterium]